MIFIKIFLLEILNCTRTHTRTAKLTLVIISVRWFIVDNVDL